MKIKSLYRDYIQKSRIFLYPLLNIKRGATATPIQTYMSWDEENYSAADSKLICHYQMRDDEEFKIFEKVKLIGNPLFNEHIPLGDGTGLYIFCFNEMDDEFWKIVTGQYSKLNEANKERILKFFKGYNTHYAYIESYLKPDKYYHMYADILNVKVKTLKACGELCEKPNLKEEDLKLGIKIMNNGDNVINLPTVNQQTK